jgi:hypothetical protein
MIHQLCLGFLSNFQKLLRLRDFIYSSNVLQATSEAYYKRKLSLPSFLNDNMHVA